MYNSTENFIPYLIAINLTRQCNLKCAHCYMDAGQKARIDPNTLVNKDLKNLFNEVSRRAPGTIMVLTGGEPLYRGDIVDLVASGKRAGLRMVLGTNGMLLNRRLIRQLKAAGLEGVGISVDSINSEVHDSFRGIPGAHQKTLGAIRECREADLHVQMHFTVTSINRSELEEVVPFAKAMGVSILNFFFLVCVGRGERRMDLTPAQYDFSLSKILRLRREHKGIMIQARCVPHYKRMLYEEDPFSADTRAMGYDGGGCPAATHYCRITPEGEVTPCPYMELSGGNLREQNFWDIWEHSTLFQSFRNPELLKGRCGQCEYKLLCGGCRARSLAERGDLLEEDPNCQYLPKGLPVIQVKDLEKSQTVHWAPEARAHLKKIPIFLRKRVSMNLEKMALEKGASVTLEFMRAYREDREKQLGIKFH